MNKNSSTKKRYGSCGKKIQNWSNLRVALLRNLDSPCHQPQQPQQPFLPLEMSSATCLPKPRQIPLYVLKMFIHYYSIHYQRLTITTLENRCKSLYYPWLCTHAWPTIRTSGFNLHQVVQWPQVLQVNQLLLKTIFGFCLAKTHSPDQHEQIHWTNSILVFRRITRIKLRRKLIIVHKQKVKIIQSST